MGEFKNLGMVLKGLAPQFIVFAAASAIFELWYKSGQKADEMNERISELTTRAQDGFKNLTKEAQNLLMLILLRRMMPY